MNHIACKGLHDDILLRIKMLRWKERPDEFCGFKWFHQLPTESVTQHFYHTEDNLFEAILSWDAFDQSWYIAAIAIGHTNCYKSAAENLAAAVIIGHELGLDDLPEARMMAASTTRFKGQALCIKSYTQVLRRAKPGEVAMVSRTYTGDEATPECVTAPTSLVTGRYVIMTIDPEAIAYLDERLTKVYFPPVPPNDSVMNTDRFYRRWPASR